MLAEAVVSAVVVLLGVGATVYVVLWALWEGLCALGRGVSWLVDADERRGADSSRGAVPQHGLICRNPSCGHTESRAARFCPKCGTRMQ
ncbi:MAG: hypothetical protein IT449_10210 [Phycisphaerales bacterium]|nr:hypothetical protein [Phycisphaerales bacterium]